MLSHSVEKLDMFEKLPADKEAKSQQCEWMESLKNVNKNHSLKKLS